MRRISQILIGRFTFCIGIGLNQIIPEFKTISWWKQKEIHEGNPNNVKFIRPKMYNVKPQPFSIQVKKK